MNIWDIVKKHSATAYDHTIKHLKIDDIVGFQRTISSIFDICKSAKSNNTCLCDCFHCEILNDKISELTKKD